MTIHYLDRPYIDTDRWDDCVAGSPQRLFYAFSWYLDAIADHWGGIVAEAEGHYLAVMPVPYRTKYGFRFVAQPVFCQQLGIFSRADFSVNQHFPAFWKVLNRQFRRTALYRFNEGNETEISWPENLHRIRRVNHVLPLDKPYETLYAQYATDRKTNLQRARNTDWQIHEVSGLQPLIDLHRQHNEAKATEGIGSLNLSLYDRLVKAADKLLKRDMARVWLARKENGDIEAGGLFVIDRNRIVYLFNGASVTGRKQQARLWMIDRLIREFSGKPMAFDFESPALGAESVKAYYASFGAQERTYSEVSYNRLEWIFRLWRQSKKIF